MKNENENYIVVQNVSKKIGHDYVLSDISMELKKGTVYGFAGHNGSGKTMMMRIICGLVMATEGEVIIDSKQIGKDISFPKSVGALIEAPAFLDQYNAFQNLKHIAELDRLIDDEKIHETIKEVGLENAEKKKYRKYSLGMKQRLGIALAIMEDPEILILDEPTNALDKDGVETVKEIIEKRKKNAVTIVASHEESVLKEIADEIFVFSDGKMVEHEKINY